MLLQIASIAENMQTQAFTNPLHPRRRSEFMDVIEKMHVGQIVSTKLSKAMLKKA